MAESKITVDNLPIDYSIQFEQNKSNQDDSLFDDASKVQGSVSRDTLDSRIDSATDLLVNPQKSLKSAWGATEMLNTKGYNTKRAFLSNQLTEKFGPQEKLDAMSVRIEGIKDELTQNSSQTTQSAQSGSTSDEKSSVENEANTLLSLVSKIGEINRIKEYIDGEMKRIQRG